jgi:flavodoxin I
LIKTGVFYGSSSGKTEAVALRIYEILGEKDCLLMDIAEATGNDLTSCDRLILGIPTWGIGDWQDDWKDFTDTWKDLSLTGKKVALFGLGDPESYPDTFADAMGKLYRWLKPRGCEIIGDTDTGDYTFAGSGALENGRFVGLVLDEDNESEQTEERIRNWLKEILA